jgi:uncharacterized membrane protein YphA (DoxX/SURF4 family)
MKSKMGNRIYLLCRIIVGIVFIWASFDKVLDPERFAEILKNYRILPAFLINPFALFLPWVEMLCGIFLAAGFMIKGSIIIIISMMVTFSTAFLSTVFRGIDISCGCFSLSVNTPTTIFEYLLRNVPLLFAAMWVLYYKIRQDKVFFEKAL